MRATLLTLILLPLSAFAQSWCPPGAEWTVNYSDIMSGTYGVQRVEYIGDTVVGGYASQRLKETRVIAPWGTLNFSSVSNSSIYTRHQNDLVHVWNGINAFDTLFWFGAMPGDHWHAPFTDIQEFTRLTVIDTSTFEVQGVALRQLVVEMPAGWGTDTLRERLGFSFLYLNGWSWFLTDQPWSGLKCYRDVEFSFASPQSQDCDFTLGEMAIYRSGPLVPFPSPGTDNFTLQLPPGPHELTLFDAHGRQVLRQQLSEEQPVISTSTLPSGIYNIRITDGRGRSSGQRWIKQ